jgi:hypothetical protein
MLVGDENRVKPDRMVLRWLLKQGSKARDPATAALLLRQVAEHLTESGRPTTPWEVDHAIWLDQKSQSNQVHQILPGREVQVHRHSRTRR